MRLFIAAELPSEVADELAETSALLRESVRGRWVAPDSLHVTLAFLGEVSGSSLGSVIGALERACAGCAPIPFSLGSLGSFGRPSRATLWQKVVSEGGGLDRLAASVRRELAAEGVPFDEKGFLAHVTLMRSADLTRAELPMPHVTNSVIRRVTLFESDLSGDRPVYEPLHTVTLWSCE